MTTNVGDPSRADIQKEWELAREAVGRFDTLIMTIRTFGLPAISTVVGAGSLFSAKDALRISVGWWTVAAPIAVLSVLFLITLLWLFRKQSNTEEVVPNALEYALYALLSLSCAGWVIDLAIERPSSFLFPAPVLISGAIVFYCIYLMDRFYYTALLLGAVNRATALEKILGFRLSHDITAEAKKWTYTALPTIFYLAPTLILLNIGLAVAAYTDAAVKPAPW